MGLLQGNFQMPLAKDCRAFGISANEQKVFGKASWHFFVFLFFFFFFIFSILHKMFYSLCEPM